VDGEAIGAGARGGAVVRPGGEGVDVAPDCTVPEDANTITMVVTLRKKSPRALRARKVSSVMCGRGVALALGFLVIR
jgi:hypothetical protein